jgi:hypothetical protein
MSWHEGLERDGSPGIRVAFSRQDCHACSARTFCTQSQHQGRRVIFQPQDQYEALHIITG